MIKSRICQLVFQTAYCMLAIVAVAANLGLFKGEFNSDFYVYYTNLSNYICIGFMFASLVYTIKSANKKEDGYISLAPTFKFLCVILISVTFLVYNILLAKENTIAEYFTSLTNLTMHVILPIMFVLDWVLFYQHPNVKWYYPLLSTIMPLIYVGFILIRAAIVKDNANVVYPYFFLNLDKLGVNGFVKWIVILVAAFVALGYLIYALDRIKQIIAWSKNKRAKTNKEPRARSTNTKVEA